jgi:cbb3-type cytochrome oxidase subunit 3
MSWEIFEILVKEHGVYLAFLIVVTWAYWQERKENRLRTKEQAAAEREDTKVMITVLVEVRDALRAFKEVLERKFPRVD